MPPFAGVFKPRAALDQPDEKTLPPLPASPPIRYNPWFRRPERQRENMDERAAPLAPDLSVVIPAYNEEKRLGPTLERVREYFASIEYTTEILVVDDGSADGTVALARDYAANWPALRVLENGRNRGKGYSVRHGMLKATGTDMLFSDADLSTPIEETARLRAAVREEGAGVAIGSRALPESNLAQRQPWYREMMGRTFNKFVQALAVPGVVDTQCGFKYFWGEVAKRVFAVQRLDGFAFDAEVLCLASRFGYAIKEVPVTWIDSPDSRVHPVKHALAMMRELFGVRWNVARGVYDRPREGDPLA